MTGARDRALAVGTQAAVNEPPPRSDAEMAAIVVGRLEVLDGQIVLAEYDPEWPSLYRTEHERIRGALGERTLLVEHVGSTSVPGLSAKPRIDIVLTVRDSSGEASYVPALDDAGYVLRVREPEWHEHRCFIRRDVDVQLHVFSDGCLEVDRMLGLRDHLRSDPGDRARYEQTKRSLASRRWKYTQHYADAKSEVVEGILASAGIAKLTPESCPCAT